MTILRVFFWSEYVAPPTGGGEGVVFLMLGVGDCRVASLLAMTGRGKRDFRYPGHKFQIDGGGGVGRWRGRFCAWGMRLPRPACDGPPKKMDSSFDAWGSRLPQSPTAPSQ